MVPGHNVDGKTLVCYLQQWLKDPRHESCRHLAPVEEIPAVKDELSSRINCVAQHREVVVEEIVSTPSPLYPRTHGPVNAQVCVCEEYAGNHGELYPTWPEGAGS